MTYSMRMAGRGGWTSEEYASLIQAYMAAWQTEVNAPGSPASLFLEQARASVGHRRNDNALRRKAHNVSAVLNEAGLPYFPPGCARPAKAADAPPPSTSISLGVGNGCTPPLHPDGDASAASEMRGP